MQPTAPEPPTSVFPLLEAPPGPPLPPVQGQAGEQRTRRRRAIVLAAVAGVAVGTAVALVITLGSTPAKKTTAPPRATTSSGAGTTSPSTGAPDGTQIVSGPRGLTLALPGDWTIKSVRNGQQADDPNHAGEFAQFNATPAADAALPDSVAAMEQKVQTDPKISNYTRLIFRSTHYGNADAAVEWAYSFTADGTKQQSAGRVWRINGSDYSMFVTAPAADFQRVRRVFETMLNTAGPL